MVEPDTAPHTGSQIILLKSLKTNWTSENNKATFLNSKMLQMIVKTSFLYHSTQQYVVFFGVEYPNICSIVVAVKMFSKNVTIFKPYNRNLNT